jgi:hypothetical protein
MIGRTLATSLPHFTVSGGLREKGAKSMEGSSMRTFPRMLLDRPIELQIGENKIQVENPANNLSVGGVYVRRGDLPVGAPVRVKIAVDHHFFEAEGQISASRESGSGIGFTALSGANREALYELIQDLTLKGLPAA